MSSDSSWGKAALAAGGVAVFGIGTTGLRDAMVRVGFFYPCFWTFGLFVFQSTLLPISWCVKRGKATEEEEASSGAPLYFYLVVTAFAYIALCCINLANNALPQSILQMLKALKLITVVILSVTFLGKRLALHQHIGVGMNVVGVSIIAYVSVSGVGWANSSLAWGGLALGCVAAVFQAMQNVWEEDAMKRYKLSPDRLSGIEGVVGTCYAAVALVVANLTGFESSVAAVHILEKNTLILGLFSAYLFCIPPDKYAARALTLYGSAIARALTEIGRTFILWFIEIALHWDRFSWTELVGYLVIAYGTMIYSKTLNLPNLPFLVSDETSPLLQKQKQQAEAFKAAPCSAGEAVLRSPKDAANGV